MVYGDIFLSSFAATAMKADAVIRELMLCSRCSVEVLSSVSLLILFVLRLVVCICSTTVLLCFNECVVLLALLFAVVVNLV